MTYEKWIDVTKGIGILLVILGHNNFSQSFLSVIHAFNMPLFFFISGYLFHYSKYKQNPTGFISQKFKRLVVPYFITNIIILCTFILMSFFKLYSFNDSPIKSLIGIFYGNGAPLNPPTIFTNLLNIPSWFLLSLFCASLILYMIAYSHEKYGLTLSLFLSLLFILFGYKISRYMLLPWSIDISCVSMIFMFSGYLINYYKKFWPYDYFKSIFYSFIFVLLLLIVISINGSVDINTRMYSNLFFFGIGGLLGTEVTIEFAKELSKKESLLTKILVYFGKNSIIILLYQSFTPIFYLSILNNFINLNDILYNSPILSSLNMLISCIVTIFIIKRVPILDRIYST